MWEYPQQNKVVHFNDRLRLFGLIMTIPRNRPLYERLAGGLQIKIYLMIVHYHQK